MALIRLTFSIISPKFSQDLTFIRRMYRAVDETGSLFALRSIYISFSALASALQSRGESYTRWILLSCS